MQRKFEAREFVVTVELDPPRGHTVDKLVQGAKLLRDKGVEIVDINDGSLGRVRMSVLATALLVRDGLCEDRRGQRRVHRERTSGGGERGIELSLL